MANLIFDRGTTLCTSVRHSIHFHEKLRAGGMPKRESVFKVHENRCIGGTNALRAVGRRRAGRGCFAPRLAVQGDRSPLLLFTARAVSRVGQFSMIVSK
jgi:hypothetical protein